MPKLPNSEYLKSLFSDFSAISSFPFIKLEYLSAARTSSLFHYKHLISLDNRAL